VTNVGGTSALVRVRNALGRHAVAISIFSMAVMIAAAWRAYLGVDHSPFTSDVRHYHYPVTAGIARALASGHLPLWTDHSFLGFPFLADPQAAVWYPGTLLIIGFGPHWGYIVFLIAHCLLAAVGMFFLMRSHGVDATGAVGSGLSIALCGYFASEAQHPGLFAILCWIPAWLCTTRAVLTAPTSRRIAAAAVVVALMMFAGTLQVMFGAILLYGAYTLGVTWGVMHEGGGAQALRNFTAAVFAQVLGLGLAAVMLVPAVAHLPQTARALGMTYEFAAMGSVLPVELLSFFTHVGEAAAASEWQEGDVRASFYLGVLALPLVIVGVRRAGAALSVGLGVAIFLLMMLALGRHGWLHPTIYALVPGAVNGLRGMGRAIGPASVGVAMFIGFGLQALAEARRADRVLFGWALAGSCLGYLVVRVVWETVLSPVGAVTAILWCVALAATALSLLRVPSDSDLLHHRVADALSSRGALSFLLACLLALDLLASGPLDTVLRANAAAPPGESAFDVIPELDEIGGAPPGAGQAAATRLMLHGFGPLNLPLLQGFDGVGGYNPLVTLQYLDFVSLINTGRVFPREPIDNFVSGAKPQRFNTPLFDATSVGYVVSNRHDHTRGLTPVKNFRDSYLSEEIGAALYENRGAMPRAYLAYQTIHVQGEDALAYALGAGFQPRHATVVEGDGPALHGASTIAEVVRGGSRPEARTYDFTTANAAVLVVTDSWYPGWRAWVDGVESPVFRVNGMFRGVAVPAGARRVETRFEPKTFVIGASISSCALVVVCILFGASFVTRRVSA
jgi:hypothetical protein